MGTETRQWVEKYAERLNEAHGDLSKLSADERKHLRLLLREYELQQQLAALQDTLSQGELSLEETDEEDTVP